MSIEPSNAYPAVVSVAEATSGRNRLTTAFRIVLAIPHLILVGGPGLGGFTLSITPGSQRREGVYTRQGGSGGLLGIAAFVCAVISWFAIVFTGSQPRGLWDFTNFYMQWRVRAIAYAALLRDEYPPFGNGPYPAAMEIAFPDSRARLSVALRLFYAIPHWVVLFFLNIWWLITTVAAWFSIVLTGTYPAGIYRFGVGAMRWNTRVEAYVLLMRDEYPPFSLD